MSGLRPLRLAVPAAARAPGAMLPVALLASAAASSGPLLLAGAAASVALLGTALGPVAARRAAAHHGWRAVLLVFASLHVLFLLLLAVALDRNGQQEGLDLIVLCAGLALAAGFTVPPASVLPPGGASVFGGVLPDDEVPSRDADRAGAAAQDLALVLGPALVGLLSYGFGAPAGLVGAAAMTTVTIPLAAWEHPGGKADGESEEFHPVPRGLSAGLCAPLPALELGRLRLVQMRGFSPALPGEPAKGITPAAGGWLRVLFGVLASGAGAGLVLAGIWVTLLGVGRAGGHSELLGFGAAGVALAAVVSSRGLPQRTGRLSGVRRHRFISVAGASASIGLLPAAVLLPATASGQLLVTALGVLLGLCLGAVTVELHTVVAQRAPSSVLPQSVSALTVAVLCGLGVGMPAAGLAADELGRGWASLIVLLGFLLLAAIALRRGATRLAS